MKKNVIFIFTAMSLLLCSCTRKGTGADTCPAIPPAAAATYGTEWAFADMDRRIMADDPDFSLTGSGFEYRDGYLCVFNDGYFDISVNKATGSEQNFILEFDAFVSNGGELDLGIWLFGVDCVRNDGLPGLWFTVKEKNVECEGAAADHSNSGAVKIRLYADAVRGTAYLYADGVKMLEKKYEPVYGGGYIKLRSSKGTVCIRNTAFRLD